MIHCKGRSTKLNSHFSLVNAWYWILASVTFARVNRNFSKLYNPNITENYGQGFGSW